MKKFSWVLIGLVVSCVALAFGAQAATRSSSGDVAAILDRFNPLVKESEVYVKVTQPVDVNGHGIADYQQTAVFADGTTRPVQFMGLQVLKVNHYLKLANKGAYVENYEEVPASAIPQAALAKLNP